MKNKKDAVEHLQNHQVYPATRDELAEECNGLSDFSKEDKAWFVTHLPNGIYYSAGEVIMSLGL